MTDSVSNIDEGGKGLRSAGKGGIVFDLRSEEIPHVFVREIIHIDH